MSSRVRRSVALLFSIVAFATNVAAANRCEQLFSSAHDLFATTAIVDVDASPEIEIAPIKPVAPLTEIKFQTTEMNPFFQGEEKPDFKPFADFHRDYVTKYMNAAEREAYRIVIVNGVLYVGSTGVPAQFPSNRVMNYVMDEAGNFYIFDQAGHDEIRHSSLFDGGPVAGAGEVLIKDDRILKINSASGHYKGSVSTFPQVLNQLIADGAQLPAKNPPLEKLTR